MKNLIVIEKALTKLKNYCFQICMFKPSFFYHVFNFSLKFFDDNFYFFFKFLIFGDLFHISFFWSKERDHAGLNFDISAFGLSIHFNIYDIRHWDYDNNKWKEYKEI